MEEETQPIKWKGEASIELKGPAPQQVWSRPEDFCSLNKWLPGLDTCYQVEGVAGQPGLIRYCASSNLVATTTMWVKEKLIMIDPTQRSLRYEIIDNNMGFKSYVATMEVLPIDGPGNDDHDAHAAGCKIMWSFVCDPVEGKNYEGFMSNLESLLQLMANKMEEHFTSLVDQRA